MAHWQEVINSHSAQISEATARLKEIQNQLDLMNEYYYQAVNDLGSGKADEAIDWYRQSKTQFNDAMAVEERSIRNSQEIIKTANKKIRALNSLQGNFF